MRKEHIYNSILKQFSIHDLVQLVYELHNSLITCVSTECQIKKLKNEEIDAFDFMSEIEMLTISNFDTISEYTNGACSEYSSITRCLRNAIGFSEDGFIYRYNGVINDVVDAWAGPTDEELEALEKYTTELAGILSHVLRYEFDLDSAMATYLNRGENVQEMDVDVAFEQYCARYNLDLIDTVKSILAVNSIYKATLPIFDENPELEEPFEQVMGPYLADIDPDALTIDIVRGILSGDIMPDKVYGLMHNEDDQEE